MTKSKVLISKGKDPASPEPSIKIVFQDDTKKASFIFTYEEIAILKEQIETGILSAWIDPADWTFPK